MNSNSIAAQINFWMNQDGYLVAVVELHNQLNQDITNWNLQFDFPKEIEAGENTRIVTRAGSHLRLQAQNNAMLPKGGRHSLCFTTAAISVLRLTDLPSGIFVNSGSKNFQVVLERHNLAALNLATPTPDNYNDSSGYTGTTATIVVGPPHSTNACAGPIIPMPKEFVMAADSFFCVGLLPYRAVDKAAHAIEWLQAALPANVELSVEPEDTPQLHLATDSTLAEEAYRLTISSNRIEIAACDSAGFFYAIASLVQLIEVGPGGGIKLPCVEIADQPRFEYRGLVLDCARQFHAKSNVLKLLDLMSLYKFNRFHWHLTDDEGWRIEIKAYPELTRLGAWRGVGEVLEPQFGSGPNRYGGYYSQEDIREIIEYAQRRHIFVIPEIDILGHSRAAIKSLPSLLLEPEDQSHYVSAQLYCDNVLNPALPGTYKFLHRVMDEVCELFPGPYIHIGGGDEVPAGVWRDSPACRELMKQHGYKNTLDLQGHLLRHIQDYLAQKGRKIMGWEEVVQGDKLDHSATICTWTETASAAVTASMGYAVVACPASFAYLDLAWDWSLEEPGLHWAGTSNLSLCYAYEPHAYGFDNEASQRQLLGVQAALWSELIDSQGRLEYMLFPRLFAMAETAWTQYGKKDWDNFLQRVDIHCATLDRRGINYRAMK